MELDKKGILERANSISTIYYKYFVEKLENNNKSDFYLSEAIVLEVAKSLIDELIRYQSYSESEYADRHKQAAYTIKWISKLKPIQILPNEAINKEKILINASFAVFVGFSFLNENVALNISPKLLQHILYTCHYRNISGKQLATTLYILEQTLENKNP